MNTKIERSSIDGPTEKPSPGFDFERLREQGTVPLLRIAGIRVRIHMLFLALILLYALEPGSRGAWSHALFLPAMLLTIAIHELGHAFAALRLGHKPRPVVLHPLLFQPTVARLPRQPRHEAGIALAGPVANAATALAVTAVLLLTGRHVNLSLNTTNMFGGSLAVRFLAFNLLIAVLNFIPAFPLDGGHALRAVLAVRMGDFRATHIVVAMSRSGAIFLAITGIASANLFICIAALLLFLGAAREQFEAPITTARLLTAKVKDAAETKILIFGPAMTVGEVFQAVKTSPQAYFPVVLGSAILGLSSRAQILTAASSGNSSLYLSSLMVRAMTVSSPVEPLDTLLQQRLPTVARPVVVTDTGTAEGLLTALLTQDSLQRWLRSQPPTVGVGREDDISSKPQDTL